jgi:hypothetical protein
MPSKGTLVRELLTDELLAQCPQPLGLDGAGNPRLDSILERVSDTDIK